MMKQSIEHMTAAFDYIPNLVLVLDQRQNIIEVNQTYLTTFKTQKEKVIDKHFTHIFESFSFNNGMELFIKSNDLEITLFHDFLIERELKHFKFILKKIPQTQSEIIIFGEDQTKLKERNNEIENYKKRNSQVSKLALMGEMISGLSLEIETPTTMVSNYISKVKKLLNETNINREEIAQKIDKIEVNTRKILKIVKNIEDFSKDHSNSNMESALVTDLINHSLELCHERLKQSEIHLIVDEIDPNLKIDCKVNLISQIILNLVGNSRDALSGLDEKWIKVSAIDGGDFVRFKFTDSGNGIPANLRDKIFNPSFSTKENSSGSGIGLYTSKEIVEEHFGKIFVDSESQNTSFVFDIPKDLGFN